MENETQNTSVPNDKPEGEITSTNTPQDGRSAGKEIEMLRKKYREERQARLEEQQAREEAEQKLAELKTIEEKLPTIVKERVNEVLLSKEQEKRKTALESAVEEFKSTFEEIEGGEELFEKVKSEFDLFDLSKFKTRDEFLQALNKAKKLAGVEIEEEDDSIVTPADTKQVSSGDTKSKTGNLTKEEIAFLNSKKLDIERYAKLKEDNPALFNQFITPAIK